MQDQPSALQWGQAGSTYYDRDGRIAALLYFETVGLGEMDGPGGEPVVTEASWLWLPADDPDQHYEIDAPALRSDMTDQELAAAHETALGQATEQVAEHLGWS